MLDQINATADDTYTVDTLVHTKSVPSPRQLWEAVRNQMSEDGKFKIEVSNLTTHHQRRLY